MKIDTKINAKQLTINPFFVVVDICRYSPEFLSSIKTLIAPPKCKLKGIAKQITAAHRSLEGLSTADAMCWFVKVWSSLDLFGVEFLSCTNLDTKDEGLIGVSKSRVS